MNKKEYNKRYYAKHKAALLEKLRTQYAEDEAYREAAKKRNRDKYQECKDGINARNRKYHAAWMREYRELHPEKQGGIDARCYHKYKAEILAAKGHMSRRNKAECVEYLGGKCVVCGYDQTLAALQFHHLEKGKKSFGISTKISNGWNLDRKELRKELEKCVILCANCHSIVEK